MSTNRPETEDDLPSSPDMDDVAENEVFCFLDHGRPCTAECIAYKTFPDESRHVEQHQSHCVVLTSVERAGRSLNIVAGLISQIVSKKKVEDADAKRAAAFDERPEEKG